MSLSHNDSDGGGNTVKTKILRGTCSALLAALLTGTGVYAQNGAATPDWMAVDHAAKTVAIELVAGQTTANNGWNYNGYANGEMTIVVPAGYAVTINFTNNDAAMVHSVGVGEKESTWPAMYATPVPVFEGALSSNPTDMAGATAGGASETMQFVADTPGEYALICYIPAHAVTGMWLGFTVSAEGEAGIQTG